MVSRRPGLGPQIVRPPGVRQVDCVTRAITMTLDSGLVSYDLLPIGRTRQPIDGGVEIN